MPFRFRWPAAAVIVFVLGLCLFPRRVRGGRAETGGLARTASPVPVAGGRREPQRWPRPAAGSARPRLSCCSPGYAARWPGPGRPEPRSTARCRHRPWTGLMLDVPHTAANIAAFGPPPHGTTKDGGFPQVQLLALAGCGTRGIACS
jgi:hypothetical protein